MRTFIQYLFSICGLLLVTTTVGQPTIKKPNVLMIVVDDLRTELNCYGANYIQSPHIDQLSEQGVLFTHAYVQQAVCSASRASFLTGCRPDVTGVDYPYSEYFINDFWPKHKTIPEFFEQQGYRVQTLGKIHHGASDHLKTTHVDARDMKYYALPENKCLGGKKGRSKQTPAYECADVPDEAYKDGVIAQRATETIKKYAQQDSPFFIAVGFEKPHLPFCAPKKYWDLYNPEEIPLAINQKTVNGSPNYATVTYELPTYSDFTLTHQGIVPMEKQRILKHAYAACVSYIDAQIGSLIHTLEETAEFNNTIIILLSDHGWHLGEQGMWGKHTNYENATHAPLILSAPGRREKKILHQLVEYVDIYPTLLDLCAFKPVDYLEGSSIVPIIDQPDLAWKEAVFSQYPRGKIEGYAIRTSHYRYVEWRLKSENRIVATELFDHSIDSLESVNRASQEEYKEIKSMLALQLKQGWKAALPKGMQNRSDNRIAPKSIAWKSKQ